MNNIKEKTILVRANYPTIFGSAGSSLTLNRRIENVIGVKVKYANVRRLSGAVDEGSVVLVHSSLGTNSSESSYYIASSTDTFSASVPQVSNIIGYCVIQENGGTNQASINVDNPITYFSSPKPLDNFSFYLTDGNLVPLEYASSYIVELVLAVYCQ